MPKERLLAYTDAVIAIIITIMVLEFKIPHTSDRAALYELRHLLLAYILSFTYLSIYRNNHHHMFHVIHKVHGNTLWLNSMLLFFLSLIPFCSWWMSENHFAVNTVVAYGIILLCCALSYTTITHSLKQSEWHDSAFTKAINKDRKGKLSIIVYIIGIIISFIHPYAWLIAYTLVALMWFIPDTRMEKAMKFINMD